MTGLPLIGVESEKRKRVKEKRGITFRNIFFRRPCCGLRHCYLLTPPKIAILLQIICPQQALQLLQLMPNPQNQKPLPNQFFNPPRHLRRLLPLFHSILALQFYSHPFIELVLIKQVITDSQHRLAIKSLCLISDVSCAPAPLGAFITAFSNAHSFYFLILETNTIDLNFLQPLQTLIPYSKAFRALSYPRNSPSMDRSLQNPTEKPDELLLQQKQDSKSQNRTMRNCVVKMIVKNKNKLIQQETHVSQPLQDNSSSRTVNYSRNNQEKDSISSQFKNLLGIFENFTKGLVKSNKAYEVEPRDRAIVYQLPVIKDGEKIKQKELEMWVTGLCREVFSSAFHYFQLGSMSYDQAKIFCSENVISNIIRLNEHYSLNPAQVKCIDQHIEEGVTSYLLTKYPMTERQVVNNALESEIKQIDNIQALENDIFYYSQDSYGFELRESGNYNDLIMKLTNDLIRRLDQKDGKVEKKTRRHMTFYQNFYDFMQKSFVALENRYWVENREDKEKGNEEDRFKKADEEKYKERVKSYTSWSIGRKISQNVTQYTQTQISSKHMIIKSPAILRILTKWCDQLWSKFQKKNYFLDRTENVKCQRGGNVNTYFSWMKTIINDMIEEEKIEIEKFVEQIFENNYDQQAVHLFRSLKGNYFTHVDRIQKAAGVFTINIVNNLHSYILLYLNRLIHGLLRVSKRVYDKQLIGRPRWTSPPNLISFKIGDLMRCKIASQEKEILRLFQYFNELSCNQPSFFRIIRVKNRLREGTNDILMNIRFKNQFICEIQLAVNTDHSNFIKCSNKYNHFIYEVKRSIFGPLTEFCSIWRSLDGRCKIYEKIANSKKEQILVQSQKSSCEISGQNHKMTKFNQPFVCSTCQQTYSHSNYIWPHQRCDICQVFTQCSKCRIDQMKSDQLKANLFKNQEDLMEKCTKLDNDEDIPKFGVCFLVESKHINPQKFVKLTIKGKSGLYFRNAKNEIDLISELNTQKEIQTFKDRYIIFGLPFQQGKAQVQITEGQAKNDYLVPKVVKNIYKKEKEFISLINEEITDRTIEKIMKGTTAQKLNIKFLELPDNQLTNVDYICDNFPNLSKLVLSRNQIVNIQQIGTLQNLEMLNVRDNLIQSLPLSICNLKRLENLNIRNNKFNTLPEQISQLTQLSKLELNQLNLKELPQSLATMTKLEYLDLTKNKLGEVPQQLRQLANLHHLGISNNNIKELPDWISELKKLRVIQCNKNKLESMPESIADLPELHELQLDSNSFTQLNFKCPASLNTIVLNDNKISTVKEIFVQNCKNLAKLQLNKNQITSLPRTLSLCKSIRDLKLKDNKLSSLPSIFGIFLTSIQSIELANNQFKKFPVQLNNCSELIQAELSNNPIEDRISQKFLLGCTKLQKLDLSKTKIPELPSKIGKLGALKRLNLSESAPNMQSLQALKDLKFLQELNMAKMNISIVPTSLKQQHYLQTLSLKDNQIDKLDDDFFDNLTHLRVLNFQNNKITRVPSLRNCKRIKVINFNNNQITAFPESIYKCFRLQRMDLNNNLIQRIDTDQSIPSTVVDLNLRANKISFIAEPFFKNAENLIRLDVSGNRLNAIPRLLRKCSKLISPNFKNNPIEFTPKDFLDDVLKNFINLPIEEQSDSVEQQSNQTFTI